MKLGFVSAILPDLSLEEVLEFAAAERFACVELMCWPKGKAERRYAGITHVDVTGFGKARIESPDALEDTILAVLADSGIRSRRCVTAVSGRAVIVRYVPMMPLGDQELRQAII